MQQFTRGPWHAKCEVVTDAGGYRPAEIWAFWEEKEPKIIATLAARPNQDANANMLAAAPELYAAVKSLLAVVESLDGA